MERIRIAGFKDANGIEHTVSFVDTFGSGDEVNQFVSEILGTDQWRFME